MASHDWPALLASLTRRVPSVSPGRDDWPALLTSLTRRIGELEMLGEPAPASIVAQLEGLAERAARTRSSSRRFIAVERRHIFPLLDLPDRVVTSVFSWLSAVQLAGVQTVCKAVPELSSVAVNMRVMRLGQVLPHLQPGETLTHALHHAELLAVHEPPTIAAGEAHTLMVSAEGTLLSCGGDFVDDDQTLPFVGHLGHGVEWGKEGEAVMRPTPVRLPLGVRPLSVCAGGYISLMICAATREVYSWGGYGAGQGAAGNVPQPAKLPSLAGVRVAMLACGSQHILILTAEGEVHASGRNEGGELGVGDERARTTPARVDSLPLTSRVCAVGAGGSHSLAITASGELLTWGHGGAGRLGHGDQRRQVLPKRVDALHATHTRLAAGGGTHSLFVSGEHLFSCGYNGDGRLGLGQPDSGVFKPTAVAFFDGRGPLRAIACGDHHSVALLERSGEVYTWGRGDDGRLGLGDEGFRAIPTLVPHLAAQIVEIVAGSDHTIVRRADGKIFSWGSGAEGQLGHGECQNRFRPMPLEQVVGTKRRTKLSSWDVSPRASALAC